MTKKKPNRNSKRKEHLHKFNQLNYEKQIDGQRNRHYIPLFICHNCGLIEHDNALKGRVPYGVIKTGVKK